jgi:hypothetical protein
LASWEESANRDPPIFGSESPALGLPIYVPVTEQHTMIRRWQMERPQDQALPTLTANVKNLQRELQDLHHSVKSTGGEHQDQPVALTAGGLVIKGK